MDHRSLCIELYDIITNYTNDVHIMRLINRNKYYNIFPYQLSPEEYDNHPIKNIYNIISVDIIVHNISSLKITVLNEISKLVITNS